MPSLGEVSDLITAFAALGTLVYAILNARRLHAVQRDVKTIEHHTNGMVAKLEAAAEAKGKAEEKALAKEGT